MDPEFGRRREGACERPQKEGQSLAHSSLHRDAAQPFFHDPPGRPRKSWGKDFQRIVLLLRRIGTILRSFFGLLVRFKPGKSSGELSSVMIRNPKVGNSLEPMGMSFRTSQI